jgi:sugar lactone lactonase YvrE
MTKSRGSYRGITTVLSAMAIVAVMVLAIAACAQTAPQVLPYTATRVAGQFGVLSNPAGTPPVPYGDGGLATAATMNGPKGVSVDSLGNIYIADTSNNMIRKVSAVTGVITTIAGTGGSGSPVDGNPAFNNPLNGPRGVFVDAYGNIWIDESSGNRVDKVTPDGVLHVVAKSSKGGFGNDGGWPMAPSTVTFYNPESVAVDLQGNVYVADVGNCIIRKITNAGTPQALINTVVGKTPAAVGVTSGKCTASTTPLWAITPDPADGSGLDCVGPNAPELGQPYDVAVDSDGNIYFADNTASKVRVCFAKTTTRGGKTYSAGKIYTIVGKGNMCVPTSTGGLTAVPGCSLNTGATGAAFSGFGPINALTADIGHPTGLRVDSVGNVYIADSSNSVIWYYDFNTQKIRAVAGYGPQQPSSTPSGWFWPGPYRPTCDNLDLHIAPTDPAYATTYGDGCPGAWAKLNSPQRIALDAAGNLFIAEQSSHVVRMIGSGLLFNAPPATPVTVNNNQTPPVNNIQVLYGAGDGPAANGFTTGNNEFKINSTCGLNPDGTPTSADTCVVAATFTPVQAGKVKNFLNVASNNGKVSQFGLIGNAQGSVAVVDPGTVNVAPGTWNSPQGIAIDQLGNQYIANTATGTVTKNQLPIITGLSAPKAVAVDAAGNVYATDTGNGKLLKLDAATGVLSTLASGLSNPAGVAVDAFGNVYVSDTGNNKIYRLDVLTKQLILVAGDPTVTCSGDSVHNGCQPLAAILNSPSGLAVDSLANLYIADQGSKSIRKIDFQANLITLASGSASMTNPVGVGVDPAGNIYFSDSSLHTVNMISSATGTLSTLLGVASQSGSSGNTGDLASSFKLNTPGAIAVDNFGWVYVTDSGNNRILQIDRFASRLDLGSVNIFAQSTLQTTALNNAGNLGLNFLSPCYTETADGAQFTITFPCSTIAPGASLPFQARFTPTVFQVNPYDDTVTLASDSLGTATINLTGTATQLPASVTTVTIAPTAVFGQPLTATVSVVPETPPGTPTGTVTCTNGPKDPSPIDANGMATVAITGLGTGTYNVECSYSGDTSFAGSSGTAQLTISAANTTTTLALTLGDNPPTPAPNPINQYKRVCFIATPTVVAPGTGAPATNDIVNFYNNGTTLLGTGKIESSGSAQYCTGITPDDPTTLAPGTYSVTANYAPPTGSNFNGSTSAVTSLTVTATKPDFGVSFSTPSLMMQSGGQASNIMTINPANFPMGTLNLSCSNLPANTWCTFVPNGMTFTNKVTDTTKQWRYDLPLTIGFTVTTGLPNIARLAEPTGMRQVLFALALLCPGLVVGGAGLLTGSRRRKSLRGKLLFLLAIALVGAMIAGGLIGCGGSSQKATPATPSGTYTVQVNAVMTGSTTASHTMLYQVVVQ